MLLTLALSALVQPPPVSLDSISLDRARTLEGKLVAASLLVRNPPWTLRGSTIVGSEDSPDGVARTLIIRGKRLEVEGKRVTAVGKLRVIDHPGTRVGREIVPGWCEIRVEEGK